MEPQMVELGAEGEVEPRSPQAPVPRATQAALELKMYG